MTPRREGTTLDRALQPGPDRPRLETLSVRVSRGPERSKRNPRRPWSRARWAGHARAGPSGGPRTSATSVGSHQRERLKAAGVPHPARPCTKDTPRGCPPSSGAHAPCGTTPERAGMRREERLRGARIRAGQPTGRDRLGPMPESSETPPACSSEVRSCMRWPGDPALDEGDDSAEAPGLVYVFVPSQPFHYRARARRSFPSSARISESTGSAARMRRRAAMMSLGRPILNAARTRPSHK